MHKNHKRIVITGGPCTGKTTLINYLKKEGYCCFNEISREVIVEYQKNGIQQPFVSNPEDFNTKLLNRQIAQFKEGDNIQAPCVFYDRGIVDIVGYMEYAGQKYAPKFTDSICKYTYDMIFILPAWEAIYAKDEQRLEDYAEAVKINDFIYDAYIKHNYNPIKVPIDTVENRISFILNTIECI